MTTYGSQKSADGRVVRRNAGSGHWYLIDGEKVQSVTGVQKNAVPIAALVGWAAKAVAGEFYDDPDFYVQLAQKQDRISFCEGMKGVPYKERDEAANKGTAVHKLAERLAKGEEVDVPEPLIGHVDSYLLYEKQWQPQDVYVELVVGSFKARYMGTLDMLAHLPAACDCPDRCLSLVDIKTNRLGPFGDVMYQLAAYKYAQFYIDSDGQLQDMPEIRHCYVLWIRADGYDLIPYDITDEHFKAFRYAQHVAYANTVLTKTVRQPALLPPKGN